MSDGHNEIECSDCETVPRLYETPYNDSTDYVVACECGPRAIDVSDAVNGNTLTQPFSGKWSNIDHNHQADR